jgi:hypothetical protein
MFFIAKWSLDPERGNKRKYSIFPLSLVKERLILHEVVDRPERGLGGEV